MNDTLIKFRDIVTNNGKIISLRLNEKYFNNINQLQLWVDWNGLTKNLETTYKKISYRMIAADKSLDILQCSYCNDRPRIIVCDESNHCKRELSLFCSIKCSAKSPSKVAKMIETSANKSKEEKSNSNKIREKTMIAKHGVAYNLQRPEVKQLLKDNSQMNAYGLDTFNKINDVTWMHQQYWVEGKSAQKISNSLNVDATSFRIILKNYKIVDNFTRTYYCNKSIPEMELYDFIKSYKESAINSYRLLPRTKELDIFIPELNLGFEYNGGYFHNESKVSKTYHKDKVNYWNDLNVRVVQIWSDDWDNKKDLVKLMILNRLGVVKKTIHARKCKVEEISKYDYQLFLNTNHILGADNPSIRLGLYYGDILVAVMGFKNIAKNTKKRVGVDLSRFSTLDVHGSFGKLLSYYRKANNTIINSIADLEIVDRYNNVYLSYGFIEDFEYDLDYQYYDTKSKLISHKFGWRKKKFSNKGYDINNKTEICLAKEAGLLKCWDSGKINYILYPDS